MKQLSQKLRDGKMGIIEVPFPTYTPQQVLIRNIYSLISVGTEGSTVKVARSSLIAKAKQRPQQVKQVFDTLKNQGPIQTYRAVMKKLDAYSSLGYSSVGTVIDAGCMAKEFKKGDLVAGAGLTANHAEVVSVPQSLCVKLHPHTDMKQAAYNTLGAIAMQGVRQADVRIGENCAVIGLGLLGQLTCLLLRASGNRVIGIDIDPYMVDIASKNCADLALLRDSEGIEERIYDFTRRIGCDAIIITAATDSLDPINFAGGIARKKATIVIVGAVPTGFDREPHFYKKELQLRMSCSYGPGRYDPVYEEKCIDYPSGYVRWTEKRNMEAFQVLIHTKKIDLSYLTTHKFSLEEAPDAYDMVLSRKEPFIGILIEYDHNTEMVNERIYLNSSSRRAIKQSDQVAIGFIGAGSYAQSQLLPNIPKSDQVVFKGVMTSTGTSSRSAGERFGFEFCTGNEKDILEHPDINTIFVATRHNTHANYVLRALQAGKHVFVEKPLCLSKSELYEIKNYLESLDTDIPFLMVGYNRRFSPFAQKLKNTVGDGPMAMIYRVNAGGIPADSWIQDDDTGGGRIVGEVCHFIDFLTFINGSTPISVYANVLNNSSHLNDTLNVSLSYVNGSIGAISYFANGDKSLSKERVEIFANGCSIIIDDFKRLVVHSNGRIKSKKLINQDKGQKNEIQTFVDCILNKKELPVSLEEIYSASIAAFEILESIRTGQVIHLNTSVKNVQNG